MPGRPLGYGQDPARGVDTGGRGLYTCRVASAGESVKSSLALEARIALYGGIFGSVGATLGWLLYVAFVALQQSWTVLLSPIVGALVGFAVNGFERYLHTAQHERQHGVGAPEPEPSHERAPASPRARAIRIGAFAALFLGVVCEHLVGHFIREVVTPFLASIATLFPAGAVLALGLHGFSTKDKFGERLLAGAILGLAVALVSALVHLALAGTVELGSLIGWWVLVSLGMVLWTRPATGPSPGRAMLGVFVAVGITFLASVPAIRSTLEKAPLWIGPGMRALGAAVDGTLSSPEIPSSMWRKAEEEMRAHAASTHVVAHAEHSGWGGAIASAVGCGGASEEVPALVPVLPPRPPAFPPLTPEEEESLKHLEVLELTRNLEPDERSELDRLKKKQRLAIDIPLPPLPPTPKSRFGKLCDELRAGWASGLVRSWFVLLCFAGGLGVGVTLERSLRPPDYDRSLTRRNDRTFWIVVAGLLGLAILLARVPGLIPHVPGH